MAARRSRSTRSVLRFADVDAEQRPRAAREEGKHPRQLAPLEDLEEDEEAAALRRVGDLLEAHVIREGEDGQHPRRSRRPRLQHLVGVHDEVLAEHGNGKRPPSPAPDRRASPRSLGLREAGDGGGATGDVARARGAGSPAGASVPADGVRHLISATRSKPGRPGAAPARGRGTRSAAGGRSPGCGCAPPAHAAATSPPGARAGPRPPLRHGSSQRVQQVEGAAVLHRRPCPCGALPRRTGQPRDLERHRGSQHERLQQRDRQPRQSLPQGTRVSLRLATQQVGSSTGAHAVRVGIPVVHRTRPSRTAKIAKGPTGVGSSQAGAPCTTQACRSGSRPVSPPAGPPCPGPRLPPGGSPAARG
jgi:hypothetical protein